MHFRKNGNWAISLVVMYWTTFWNRFFFPASWPFSLDSIPSSMFPRSKSFAFISMDPVPIIELYNCIKNIFLYSTAVNLEPMEGGNYKLARWKERGGKTCKWSREMYVVKVKWDEVTRIIWVYLCGTLKNKHFALLWQFISLIYMSIYDSRVLI